jgi:hypothetical protein
VPALSAAVVERLRGAVLCFISVMRRLQNPPILHLSIDK